MTWNPSAVPDLTGRTHVVTGATGGIGYFAAEQLAAAGARVVLASRTPARLRAAEASIREQVPGADVGSVVLELTSLESVSRAAKELAELPRLDGVFLNGGAMTARRGATTQDGVPLMLGSHAVANVALVGGLLPALAATGREHGVARVVHASTWFVRRFRAPVGDLVDVPRLWVAAYTHAKVVTEIFAFELDRRLRAEGLPVASIVSHPGVGVDARTPHRTGVHDATTPRRRNPYTPWAQGKDSAAWSAVRALTDPDARGGQFYGPSDRLRGLPVLVEPVARTARPDGDEAARVWRRLEDLAGVRLGL